MTETFMRISDVSAATGLSRPTIYRLMKEQPPRFPRPINVLGPRTVAWLQSEIAAWQQERIHASKAGV